MMPLHQSVPALSFCPNFPTWWTTGCKIKSTLSFPSDFWSWHFITAIETVRQKLVPGHKILLWHSWQCAFERLAAKLSRSQSLWACSVGISNIMLEAMQMMMTWLVTFQREVRKISQRLLGLFMWNFWWRSAKGKLLLCSDNWYWPLGQKNELWLKRY